MSKKIKFISYLLICIIFFVVVKFGYSYLKGDYEKGNNKDITIKDKEETLKNFEVYDEKGKKINIESFINDKPLVINFWASWCPPCKEEMPYFNNIKNIYGDKVKVLMVNLTDGQRETREKARSYIDSLGYDFNILYDEDLSAAKIYKINQIPRTLFVNKDGIVIKDHIGAITEEKLKDYLDKIVK